MRGFHVYRVSIQNILVVENLLVYSLIGRMISVLQTTGQRLWRSIERFSQRSQ